MARNLIINPCGEDEMENWELTSNGGDGWIVKNDPATCGFLFNRAKVTTFFATSFQLCLKKQVINLLAKGFSRQQLDAAPVIAVEDWYSGRTDCGCTYQITVNLLDENLVVIKEFKPDVVTLDPNVDNCSWQQVTHMFSDYGPGVRFISFEHGGQDTKFWKGWYGVRVTGSSVTVDA